MHLGFTNFLNFNYIMKLHIPSIKYSYNMSDKHYILHIHILYYLQRINDHTVFTQYVNLY